MLDQPHVIAGGVGKQTQAGDAADLEPPRDDRSAIVDDLRGRGGDVWHADADQLGGWSGAERAR